MKRKKILIISAGFLPVPGKIGGVETLITNFIEQNEKIRNFKITLITLEGVLEEVDYSLCTVIQIHRNKILRKIVYLGIILKKLLKMETFENEYYNYVVRRKVKKIKNNFDCILIENNIDLLRKLKKELNHNFFYHIHNDDVNKNYSKRYLRNIQVCFNKINKVIAVSHYIKRSIENVIEVNNVVVVNNCIDVRRYSTIYNNYYVSNYFNIYYIGRLIKEKGIEQLIEAFGYIKNEKVCLKIVGDTTGIFENYYKFLLKKVHDGKINCKFLGYVPNDSISQLFESGNSIVVVPTYSVEEASGLVAIEAIASGVPIIVSDSGELPFFIPNYAGIIVRRDEAFIENLYYSMLNLIDKYSFFYNNILINQKKFLKENSLEKYYENVSQILNANKK